MKNILSKFRAKPLEELVENQLLFGSGIYFVEFSEKYKKEKGRCGDWYMIGMDNCPDTLVDPSTIGQFIGKLDDKGKEIYSNDGILVTFKSNLEEICKVFYDEKSASFRLKRKTGRSIGFGYAIKKLKLMDSASE